MAVPVSWELFEPREGAFREAFVTDIISQARENNLKLILLWFGTWKNGTMEYTPSWVKKDTERFPRAELKDGRKTHNLSPHCPENLEADRKAFCRLLEVVKRFDQEFNTVIGVQIENEYGHCGGLQAEDGEAHMRRLKELAVKAGFEVPYYTATGWGGAATGGLLPVLGGYCDAPWDPRITEIEPSVNYVFTRERNDRNIGSDQRKGEDLTWSCDKFPYLTAELGGGIQVTKHRRPVASNRDIGAMTLTKLGCGANLLGYYMYHGGINPEGKDTTLQESRATGYNNDLPVKATISRPVSGSRVK